MMMPWFCRTNELGLVTLFEQRPFWHCLQHDEYLCEHHEDPMWHWCYYCMTDSRKAYTKEAKHLLAKAIARALKELTFRNEGV